MDFPEHYQTPQQQQNNTVIEKRESVFNEIERQLNVGVGSLPPESRCLLELDLQELRSRQTDDQQHWLYAITAARQAGLRAMQLSEGKTAS